VTGEMSELQVFLVKIEWPIDAVKGVGSAEIRASVDCYWLL
jgi:hypothetical protein